MSLATRISKLRLEKGQSLQEVADAVGVSKAHIWEIEKARATNPSMNLISRLANHFGVTVTYLSGEDINAPDSDSELQRMFRQANNLNSTERAILDDMIQSLLKRQNDK